MSEPRGVHFETDGEIGHVMLDRPDAANAFDLSAAHALGDALNAAEASGVRAVLVRGAGKRFCAGGDVAAFADAHNSADYLFELATVLEANVRRLSALAIPVVVATQGAVAGAGLSLVLNADVVISARSTKFVMAYSSIGLTPDCGISWLLPRVVGQQRALSLALASRVLGAEEALQWGLVSEVVDDDKLNARGVALATQLAGGPTTALAEAKRLLRGAWESGREASAQDEARTIARMVSTERADNLISSFLSR